MCPWKYTRDLCLLSSFKMHATNPAVFTDFVLCHLHSPVADLDGFHGLHGTPFQKKDRLIS